MGQPDPDLVAQANETFIAEAKADTPAPDAPEGFRLQRALRKLRRGEPLTLDNVSVVFTHIHGRDFRFVTTHARDPIQRKWRKGMFYEPKELEAIRAYLPLGGVFVDIGANVGNHALFVAAFLSPGQIIPFEPNPEAYRLLVANAAMNGLLDKFDFSFIGKGVSDSAGTGFAMDRQPRNLGGTKMRETPGGEIVTIAGDTALHDRAVDVIKVDVEGMEMKVLAGLEQTITRCRPVLLLEIEDSQDAAFHDWVTKHSYTIAESVRRYQNNTNYVVLPG